MCYDNRKLNYFISLLIFIPFPCKLLINVPVHVPYIIKKSSISDGDLFRHHIQTLKKLSVFKRYFTFERETSEEAPITK